MPLELITSCDGCGACCQRMIVPPFRIDAEFNEPQALGVPRSLVEEFLATWEVRWLLPASPCSWYDEATGRCRHYEFRPRACRDFELGGTACRETRREVGIDP